jgi:hypothetical protein
MARKPNVLQDKDQWGTILNEYLNVAHNPDGTLKTDGLATAAEVAAVETSVATHTTALARVDPGTAGSAGQSLRRGPSGPVWADDIINVKAAGAKGDGTTNDTTVLQGLIDTRTTESGGKGAVLYFPPGTYLANLTLKNGVILSSLRETPGRLHASVKPVVIKGADPTKWVITSSSSTPLYCAGVVGIDIEGDYATAVGGVLIYDGTRCTFKRMHIAGFQNQGFYISNGGSCMVEDIMVTSCLRNRARASVAGAFQIGGTDHFVNNIEAGASLQNDLSTVSSTSLYCVGVLIASNSAFYSKVYGEYSDRGVLVSGDRNRFTNCRGDHNYGINWDVSGRDNQFDVIQALDGSLTGAGTYSGVRVSGRANIFTNVRVMHNDGNFYSYAFEDTVSVTTVSERNQYVGCFGTQYVTAEWSFGSTWTGAAPLHAPNITRVSSGTTIGVQGLSVVSVQGYTAATTVTNFTGGLNGQTIYVIGDPDVTLENGANIKTSTGANLTLAANRAYTFVFFSNVWYQV